MNFVNRGIVGMLMDPENPVFWARYRCLGPCLNMFATKYDAADDKMLEKKKNPKASHKHFKGPTMKFSEYRWATMPIFVNEGSCTPELSGDLTDLYLEIFYCRPKILGTSALFQ